MQYANTYGSDFFNRLSSDLRQAIPDAKGLSAANIRYMHRFYCLYASVVESDERSDENLPQPVEDLSIESSDEPSDEPSKTPIEKVPQRVEILPSANALHTVRHLTLQKLFSVPWAHHRYIIDRCKGECCEGDPLTARHKSR